MISFKDTSTRSSNKPQAQRRVGSAQPPAKMTTRVSPCATRNASRAARQQRKVYRAVLSSQREVTRLQMELVTFLCALKWKPRGNPKSSCGLFKRRPTPIRIWTSCVNQWCPFVFPSNQPEKGTLKRHDPRLQRKNRHSSGLSRRKAQLACSRVLSKGLATFGSLIFGGCKIDFGFPLSLEKNKTCGSPQQKDGPRSSYQAARVLINKRYSSGQRHRRIANGKLF